MFQKDRRQSKVSFKAICIINLFFIFMVILVRKTQSWLKIHTSALHRDLIQRFTYDLDVYCGAVYSDSK